MRDCDGSPEGNAEVAVSIFADDLSLSSVSFWLQWLHLDIRHDVEAYFAV